MPSGGERVWRGVLTRMLNLEKNEHVLGLHGIWEDAKAYLVGGLRSMAQSQGVSLGRAIQGPVLRKLTSDLGSFYSISTRPPPPPSPPNDPHSL